MLAIQEAPELPHREVIAFAYAALEPPERFFHEVAKMAVSLEEEGEISARSHQLLRGNIVAQEMLYATISGEDTDLNKRNMSETIEHIASEIKKEEREALSKEKNEHEMTKGKLSKIAKKADRISKKLSEVLSLIVIALIVGVPVLGWFVLRFTDLYNIELNHWSFDIVSLLVTLLTMYGVTILSLYGNIQEKMRSRIRTICSNVFEIDTDSKE